MSASHPLRRCTIVIALAAAVVVCAVARSPAQTFPNRTITLVVGLIAGAYGAALRHPAVRGDLKALGFVPRTMTSDEFAALLHDDMSKWPAIAAAAGISAD